MDTDSELLVECVYSAISNSIISGLSLVALLLCSGFSYWVARSIVKSVGLVTNALGEDANGSLRVQELDIATTNEMGKLAVCRYHFRHRRSDKFSCP